MFRFALLLVDSCRFVNKIRYHIQIIPLFVRFGPIFMEYPPVRLKTGANGRSHRGTNGI